MRIWNRILVALVLVLAAAVGFLLWKVYNPRPDYRLPPPPPVPASLPAADRQAISERFAKLQKTQEQFAKVLEARDKRFEAALAEARKRSGGGGADAAQWQKALNDHREQWAKYQQENEAWRQKIAQGFEIPSPETDLPPPPSPPLPEGPEPDGDPEQADQEFAAFAGVAAAALCIAEPPLCLIAGLFEGLFGEGREEFVRLAEAVALGEGVDPAVVDAAGKLMRDDPEAREAFLKIVEEKAGAALEDNPELAEIKRQVAPIIAGTTDPQSGMVIGGILRLIAEGGPCEDLLPQLPVRDRLTETQRQELEFHLVARQPQDYDRLWKDCLEPHYATVEGQP